MKTIGIIGGMSWESTLEYYRIINEEVKRRLGKLHSAKVIINSFDFQEIEELQHSGEWNLLTDKMIEAAFSLKKAGAEFIVIATNTMHKMADEIEKTVGLEVFHIADATAIEIEKKGLGKVALLGTEFTMTGDFYKKRIEDRFGIDVIIPDSEDRKLIHDIIYNELCLGIIKDESKKIYLDIMKKLEKQGAEGVILGCTEIPLLIKNDDCDIRVFDTTYIHSVEAVKKAVGGEDE